MTRCLGQKANNPLKTFRLMKNPKKTEEKTIAKDLKCLPDQEMKAKNHKFEKKEVDLIPKDR